MPDAPPSPTEGFFSWPLTILTVLDALTRMNREAKFGGERTDADVRAASLLNLVFDDADRIVLAA